MKEISYSYKKYKNLYILWLQNSNQYIVLKKHAFDIFHLSSKGAKKSFIYAHLIEKYGFDWQSGKNLVEEILQTIEQFNVAAKSQEKEINELEVYKNQAFTPACNQVYLIDKKRFSISFENKSIKDYLQPLFSHLYPNSKAPQDFHFELLTIDNLLILREGQNILEIFPEKNLYLLPNRLITIFLNKLHNKTEEDWLIAAHASAITNGEKAVLITAETGGGKTTLTALLQNQGFSVVADDLVQVDTDYNAYCFPTAMSIKKGSWPTLFPLYPELENKPEQFVPPNKIVKYLTPLINENKLPGFFPANDIVFVDFASENKNCLTKILLTEGIAKFLQQAYIKPIPEHAEAFLDWAVQASFYKLTYSDNNKAFEFISEIFKSAQFSGQSSV